MMDQTGDFEMIDARTVSPTERSYIATGLTYNALITAFEPLSYERPSGFLAALGKPELNAIGVLLDAKMDNPAHTLCGMPLQEERGTAL